MDIIKFESKIKKVEILNEKIEPKIYKRPFCLDAKVYKLKSPLTESALYITISDINENGNIRPFEIFINSKEVSNTQWVVILTRLISAIFRSNSNPVFIIEELKSIFDPKGGYISKEGYVPSLVAEIGMVIEKHFENIGLISKKTNEILEQKKEEFIKSGGEIENAEVCPKCFNKTYVNISGCFTCLNCGHGKCS